MIYNILFAVCGIGLIALGLRLAKLDKLAALEQRVRVLEEQMSGLLMVTDESNLPDPEDEGIVI